MKLSYPQLAAYLQRNTAHMSPIFLLSGDEPLQLQEATDLVRQVARTQNFIRKSYQVTPSFDWQQLAISMSNQSLFSEKTLLELHMGNKLSATDKQSLRQFAENPLSDTLVFAITHKLESNTQQAAWYKTIDQQGVIIQVWPVDEKALPKWIAARLHQEQLTADREGIALLANCTAGNLLASAQTITKLRLQYGPGHLNVAMIQDALSDQSQYTVFAFVDTLLRGETGNILKILRALQREKSELHLLIWAIAREFRLVLLIQDALSQGIPLAALWRQHNIWLSRQAAITAALGRFKKAELERFIVKLSQIEALSKGGTTLLQHTLPYAWLRLSELCLKIAKRK